MCYKINIIFLFRFSIYDKIYATFWLNNLIKVHQFSSVKLYNVAKLHLIIIRIHLSILMWSIFRTYYNKEVGSILFRCIAHTSYVFAADMFSVHNTWSMENIKFICWLNQKLNLWFYFLFKCVTNIVCIWTYEIVPASTDIMWYETYFVALFVLTVLTFWEIWVTFYQVIGTL